jgi:anti-sigma-K factor RskA
MMDTQRYLQESDEALSALLASYRAASPDPEPSANFMPQLWQKIEARERTSKVFTRLTRNLVTAALALSMLLALAVEFSRSRGGALPSETYVEVLADDNASQDLYSLEPVRVMPVYDRQD